MQGVFTTRTIRNDALTSAARRVFSAIFFCLFSVFQVAAQKDSARIYNPNAVASLQVQEAFDRARLENKHVILMIGGNWCRWCLMFEKFRLENARVDSAIAAGFIWQHVNHSKENRNAALLSKLEFPQRFGFPVFVVLDGNGKRLHTQNSAYLEEGEGYSESRVLEFLRHWGPEALNPANY